MNKPMVVQCDKCRKKYEEDGTARLKVWLPSRMDGRRYIFLCPSCEEELADWLGVKGALNAKN